MRSHLSRGVLVALTVALCLLVPCGMALADGDPASDVLLGENVFYPYSPPTGAALQKALNAETTATAKQRLALKVALIGSPIDLGVVPDLFGKPQQYANFLDQEISFQATKQPLLVVMAAGYGVQGLSPAAQTALSSLKPPAGSSGNALARAATVAVARVARAEGHPVTIPGSGGGGSAGVPLVAVLAAAAVLVAAALALLSARRRREQAAGA